MESFVNLLDQPWAAYVIPAAVVVLYVISLLSAFHSLQHVRTSQAAVAWVIGLITIPYLTLPLYWIFARHRFSGYREAIREIGKQHEHVVASIRSELFTKYDTRTTSLRSALEQVADVLDTPIIAGNSFRLLIDGDAFFETMLAAIRTAKRYIYAEFYIIRDDETGNRFADALIERARDGVKVRLLYDEVGCLCLSTRYLQRLSDAGVNVLAFNTRQGWVNRFQINFRNHRKLLVVDGQRAVVGGLNIGDEYLGKASWAKNWRDTSVDVTGNIARKVQAVFAGDYFWAARTSLPEAQWGDMLNDDESTTPSSDEPTGLACVCCTGPADSRPRATMMFTAAIHAAKTRLWISTPYLVPNDALLVALAMARTRGVDVRLLIPSEVDHWGAYLASFYYERQLAEIGVPVFRFTRGMFHQKCVLVDDELAMIGSTNLDNRSLDLNFELMIAIDDREFIESVATMLNNDFNKSSLSNGADVPLRPWFARIGTAVARLFSPVL